MDEKRYVLFDFDGVIAGAQANPRTGQAMLGVALAQAILKDPATRIPPAKFPMIHDAVVKACDNLDGLKDGLIGDPRKCKFDAKTLQCKGAEAADCLTAAQVAAFVEQSLMEARMGRLEGVQDFANGAGLD